MKSRVKLICLSFVFGLMTVAFLLAAAGSPLPVFAATDTCVAGPHTGILAADETWCKSDSPHIVNVQFTVPAGITLTIEPGVTVMTTLGLHKDFLILGHLEALGTPAEPITFTSSTDTGPKQWGGLAFDGGTGHLQHVTVRYAGERNSVTDDLGPWVRGGIAICDVSTGEVRLENVTIRDIASTSQDMGIYVDDSNLVVVDSMFTGIGNGSYYIFPDTPIYIAGGDSDVTLTNNTFTANNANSVVLQAGAMMNHDTTINPQNGLDGYVLEKDFTVPPTVTLTIEPGVTVMGNRGGNHSAELRIEGHLDAIGTPTQPITFTSFDDSAPSQWPGLVFDGSAGTGTGDLRYATVRYGGIGNSVLDSISSNYHSGSNITVYNVQNGEVRLDQVRLESEYNFDGWHKFLDHGLYINNSRVEVVDSTVEDNCDSSTAGGSEDSGVFVTGDSQVIIEDSLIQSNSAPGLLIEGDQAFVKVTRSSIVNNIGDGVRNVGAATVILSGDAESGNSIHSNQGFGVNQAGTSGQTIATNNWWGDSSGPTHSGNPSGTGEAVTDRVLYNPWLTAPPTPPAVIAGMVQLAAPNEVSVGQTVNLGVLFQNIYTETLNDAIIVLEIPWQAEYQYSTHDGQFWPLHNRVIWKLGDVAPGETFSAIAQVWYKWGTPNGTQMPAAVMVAADNYRNSWVTYEEHLAYEELKIDSTQELTQAEVDTILANDAELNGLYQHALGEGFDYYGNAELLELNGGVEWFEMLLMDLDRPGEILAVRRIGEDRHIRHETSTDVSLYTLTGGARFDFETAEWEFWGDLSPAAITSLEPSGECQPAQASTVGNDDQITMADWNANAPSACPHHNWGDCLRGCLINQIPTEMSDPSLFGGKSSCDACVACEENCLEVCSQCARDLWKDHQNEHYHNCTEECADSSNWNNYQCKDNYATCYDAPRNESRFGRSQYRLTYKCDKGTCKYLPNPTLEYCPYGCAFGETAGDFINTECVDCEDFLDFVTEAQCIRALTAHDPNALYGPQLAAPGQTIEYTVEWENEGKGTAYGVYVESYLPPELDASTLEIGGNGVYFPGSRTLMWQIGELEPGAGDSVTFTVQVPTSAVSGTVMVAEATVFFPSVPETTPTNPVVTLIQDVAADGQQVETDVDTPVAIILSGYSPSGNPLVYTITADPSNGSLTGATPNLTYSPETYFEGQDMFRFTVSDGINTSLPAIVTIVVDSGIERIYLPLIIQ
jgi:uncharacterized repeat protein (TIGR01451 family)